jgi:hypothetical protein
VSAQVNLEEQKIKKKKKAAGKERACQQAKLRHSANSLTSNIIRAWNSLFCLIGLMQTPERSDRR